MALPLALLGPAAIAGADPSSDVLVTANVYAPSGISSDSVTVGALQANPGQCPTYQGGQSMNELGRQGFVDVPLAPNATWSLATVLGCLQTPIPLTAVKGITVIAANGSPEAGAGSQLTPPDLASTGSDFNKPAEYPVVQALGSLNQYDRPWRGTPQGQSDYDFLDEVQATQSDQPSPVAIEVFEGPLLTVTANASPTSVPVGGTVRFSATVTGPNDGGLSYSWNFDGGAPNSTTPGPQATFTAAGQYDVTVLLTDSAGGGGSAEVPVTVGTPAPADTGSHGRSGAGTSHKSHSPTGPRKSSGNHAGSPAGAHPSQPSSPARTTSTPTGSSAAGPSSPSTTGSRPSSTTPAGSHPSTPGPSQPSTPSNPSTPARHANALGGRTSPLSRAPAPRVVEGPLVSGQLISDVTTLPAGASPLVHSAAVPADSAPPARQAVRSSPVPVLAAALAIVLLLGLGAGRELRGGSGWHALLRGS